MVLFCNLDATSLAGKLHKASHLLDRRSRRRFRKHREAGGNDGSEGLRVRLPWHTRDHELGGGLQQLIERTAQLDSEFLLQPGFRFRRS